MHASPQRLRIEEPGQLPSLRPVPPGPKLEQRMLRFLRLLRLGLLARLRARRLRHRQSLGLFLDSYFLSCPVDHRIRSGQLAQRRALPARDLLRSGQHSARRRHHRSQLFEGSGAASSRPAGHAPPLITLWTASGVMISWMDGFRRCYELPKTWGLVQERLIAFLLVVFALVPMTFATLLVAVGQQVRDPPASLHRSRFQRLRSAALGRRSAGSSPRLPASP